jgi:hypothetical protein
MGEGATASDGGTSPIGPDFQALLRFTRFYPKPRSLAKIVTDSSGIVFGRFAGVADGRIVDYKVGASNPILTAVFEISIDEVISGPPAERIFVELARAPVAPIEKFRASLPSAQLLFIIQPPSWDESVYDFKNTGAGFPANETLNAFSLPFGIVVEDKDGLTYPLLHDPGELPDEVFQAKTYDDVRVELQSLVSMANRN